MNLWVFIFIFFDQVSERFCDVQFTVNQSTFRCMHRAIGLLQAYSIRGLFPPVGGHPPPPFRAEAEVINEEEVALFNGDIGNNKEQMQSVRMETFSYSMSLLLATFATGLSHRFRDCVASSVHLVRAPRDREDGDRGGGHQAGPPAHPRLSCHCLRPQQLRGRSPGQSTGRGCAGERTTPLAGAIQRGT